MIGRRESTGSDLAAVAAVDRDRFDAEPARLRTLHEVLSLATLAALALHGVVLPPRALLGVRWRSRVELPGPVVPSHSPLR